MHPSYRKYSTEELETIKRCLEIAPELPTGAARRRLTRLPSLSEESLERLFNPNFATPHLLFEFQRHQSPCK